MSDCLEMRGAFSEAVTRRRFLKLGVLVAGAALAPAEVLAALSRPERSLGFYNTHTGENLKTVYWEHGRYVPGALEEINYILRDFRANEVKPIAPGLLDLLHTLNSELDTCEPFHVISGYRSPMTNAMLAARSEGVARQSLHIDGKAIDLRVPGRALSSVHQAALALRGGGVGYYPRADFVHVDIGRVRRW